MDARSLALVVPCYNPRIHVAIRALSWGVSAHPGRVAIPQAKPTTAVVVPRGIHQDLDAERVAAVAASLKLVAQRVPLTIRELVSAHHVPVDPDCCSLGKGGLWRLLRSNGEDACARW